MTCVVTPSEIHNDGEIKYAAVIRPQDDSSSSINLFLRTTEGEYGKITCIVVPNDSGPKTANVCEFEIKPLSLHSRISEFSSREKEYAMNSLRIRGEFSTSTGHSWVQRLCPGTPSYSQVNVIQEVQWSNSMTSFLGRML